MTKKNNEKSTTNLEANNQKQSETILKYENILEHMQEMAHMGWWEFDVFNQKITWTKQVFAIHGLDPAQGEPSYEGMLAAIHPDDRDYFNTTVGRALEFGEPYKIHYRVVHPDQTVHHLYVQSEVKTNDQDQVYWLIGIVMDMTEREQAGVEMRRLVMAVEQATDGIAIADMEGHILFANPAWADMHDYQVDELPGKHLGIFHTEEQVQNEVMPFNEQVMQTGSHQGEVGHIKKDGTIFPTWMTSTILKDESGTPIGLAGTARDITERKQIEELVSRLKSLVDNTNDFISTSDLEGNVFYTNPMGLEMIGLPADTDPTTTKITDHHSPEWARTIGEEYLPVVMEKGLWTGEVELQHVDGSPIPASGVIMLVRDEAGGPIGFGAIYRDITAQKETEIERERLHQEIIEAQQRALKELATPVIPIMERIIVMPLVGSIDSMRAKDIMRTLLAGIRRHRAKVVILDITGVGIVDSGVAGHLDKTIQAARLKGARTIITGISDAVAETIVDLGIDWSNLETLSDLQTGLIVALSSLGIKLNKS